ADAAAAPRVVVYVAPEPWHTAAEVRPVLTQVLANANAAPAEPAVWLRTAAERRTLTAAEARGGPLPAWAAPAAAEAPPLARLVPDLVAEPGAPHLPPDGAAAA